MRFAKVPDMESDLIPAGRRSDSVKLRSWNFHCARPEEAPHNKTCSKAGLSPPTLSSVACCT